MRHLGIIWGLLLLLQDLSNYYMYVLLITSVPKYVTCGNFLEYYAKFSIISTILSCFFYTLSGLLIDYYSKKLFTVLIVLNIYGMLIFSILGMPYLLLYNEFIYDYSIFILCTGWQIQQLISILLNNVYWKIIKQNVESTTSIYEINSFNNYTKIGNTGDITCNISELGIFSFLIVLIYIFDIELNIILVYFFMIICMLYIMLLILIVKLVNYDYTLFNDIFLEITLFQKFRYVYHNKKIYNTLIHAFILLLFTAIIQYPLSMHEMNEINSIEGICNGKLNNIFMLALLMSIVYLIGSLSYKLFIVNMNKIIFYRYIYPGCTLFIILLLLPVWITTYSFLIFISISQAIPYYLNYYNYYIITNYIDDAYYGFVLGIYGTINTILILIAQLLFLFEINKNVIFGLSIALLLISSIYSAWLRHILDNKNGLDNKNDLDNKNGLDNKNDLDNKN